MERKSKIALTILIIGLVISIAFLACPLPPTTGKDFTPFSQIIVFEHQPLIFDVVSKAAANARAGGIVIFVGVEKWKPTIYFLHRGIEYNISNMLVLKHYDGYIIYTDSLEKAKKWALEKIDTLNYNLTKAEILYEKFRKFHDPPTLWASIFQYRSAVITASCTITLASMIMFYDKSSKKRVKSIKIQLAAIAAFLLWLLLFFAGNVLAAVAFVVLFILMSLNAGLITYRRYGFWASFGVGGILLTLVHAVIAPPIYLTLYNKYSIALTLGCLLIIGLIVAKYSKVKEIEFNPYHLTFISILIIAMIIIYGITLGETTPYPYLFVEPDNPDRMFYLTLVSTSNDSITIMRAYPFHYFERLLVNAPSIVLKDPLASNLIIPPVHRFITLFIGITGIYALTRYLGFDERVAFMASVLRIFIVESWYAGLHRSMPASFALAYLPTNIMLIYDYVWFSIPLAIFYGQTNLVALYFILVPTFATVLVKGWKTKLAFFTLAVAAVTAFFYKPLFIMIIKYVPTVGAYYYNFFGYLGQVAALERYVILYNIAPPIIILGFWSILDALKGNAEKKKVVTAISAIIYFLLSIYSKGFMIRSCEPLATILLPFFTAFMAKEFSKKDVKSSFILVLMLISLVTPWISPARIYYIGGMDSVEINYIVKKLPKDGYLMSDSASMKIFGLAGYTVGYDVTNTDNNQASYIKEVLLGKIPKPHNNLCVTYSGELFIVERCPKKEYFVLTMRTFQSIANKYQYFWLCDATWDWLIDENLKDVLTTYHFGDLYRKYNVVEDELYFVVFEVS